MAKVTINNLADPQWQAVIQSKLQLMLGSMLAHISRIDVEFGQEPAQRGTQETYSCKLAVTESKGEHYLLYNYQPDPYLAIEGAIARARRATTRLSRARSGSRGQVSA